jgi:hypothetical protein
MVKIMIRKEQRVQNRRQKAERRKQRMSRAIPGSRARSIAEGERDGRIAGAEN